MDADGSQLVLGLRVSVCASDRNELVADVEAIPAALGAADRVLADSGYATGSEVSQLEGRGMEVLVATGAEGQRRRHDFRYRCRAGSVEPDKRAQLGAHYTDRDKIMLIVEPVVIRTWLAQWAAAKAETAAELERAPAAKTPATRAKRRNEAERRYRAFLNRLRKFTLLDPACGSGNFFYLAPRRSKDLEHRVQFEAEALSFQRALPQVGPANVKGIESNPYAAELASVLVGIAKSQWMRRAASANPTTRF